MMVRGIWMVLSGRGGELARKFVPDNAVGYTDVTAAFVKWIRDDNLVVEEGDTFSFVEGESER